MACGLDGTTRYEVGPSLANLPIAHASIGTELHGVSTGEPIVIVQLDAAGAKTFAAVSRSALGKRIAFLVGDEVVMAPVVAGVITDGVVGLTPDPYTEAGLRRLEAALSVR